MTGLRTVLGRTLVVSAYFDDAALACGELIAAHRGCVVATVFAGTAETSANADSAPAGAAEDQAIRARREGDRDTLAILGARALWMKFVASEPLPSAGQIAEALAATLALEQADTVLVPLGLGDAGNVVVHEGARAVMRASAVRWLGYEEIGVRREPGALQRRLAELLAASVVATPIALRTPTRKQKRLAIQRPDNRLRNVAGSGHRVTPGFADATAPEGYWLLTVAT